MKLLSHDLCDSGRIQQFRVRVCEERRENDEVERERKEESEVNRVEHPYMQASGPGFPIPGPSPFNDERLIKVLMDLDQSNAPGALA